MKKYLSRKSTKICLKSNSLWRLNHDLLSSSSPNSAMETHSRQVQLIGFPQLQVKGNGKFP